MAGMKAILRRVPIWPFRRAAQGMVLIALVALPVMARYRHYVVARQYEKLVEQWEGSPQAAALRTADAVAKTGLGSEASPEERRRVRKAVLDRTERVIGSPWSARFLGISMTDLLAATESMAASRWVPWVLVVSIVLPLALSVLLGRVYCGWLCPAGPWFDLAAKTRALLRSGLELPLPTVRVTPRAKYLFLAAGLAFALATGAGVVHYLYPPALMSREAHNVINAQFNLAEEGTLRLAVAGFSGGAVLLLVLFAIETLVAPRLWCRSLCPGGAIYSALAHVRLLRVRRAQGACTGCAQCDRVCPMLLKPMSDGAGTECDACGLCTDACPEDALHFRISMTSRCQPGTPPSQGTPGHTGDPQATAVGGLPNGARAVLAACLAASAFLAAPPPAEAHHIRGIPHYAYDKNYPQAPVLKLIDVVGPWQFQLTSYPGNPAPAVATQMHVYVANKDSREVYSAPMRVEVRRQGFLWGDEIVYSCEEQLSENLFRFRPKYPDEGNYLVTLSFHDGVGISTLTFPIVVGEPGSPWWTLGCWVGAFVLFVLIIRAARVKLRRRRLRAAQAVAREGQA